MTPAEVLEKALNDSTLAGRLGTVEQKLPGIAVDAQAGAEASEKSSQFQTTPPLPDITIPEIRKLYEAVSDATWNSSVEGDEHWEVVVQRVEQDGTLAAASETTRRAVGVESDGAPLLTGDRCFELVTAEGKRVVVLMRTRYPFELYFEGGVCKVHKPSYMFPDYMSDSDPFVNNILMHQDTTQTITYTPGTAFMVWAVASTILSSLTVEYSTTASPTTTPAPPSSYGSYGGWAVPIAYVAFTGTKPVITPFQRGTARLSMPDFNNNSRTTVDGLLILMPVADISNNGGIGKLPMAFVTESVYKEMATTTLNVVTAVDFATETVTTQNIRVFDGEPSPEDILALEYTEPA